MFAPAFGNQMVYGEEKPCVSGPNPLFFNMQDQLEARMKKCPVSCRQVAGNTVGLTGDQKTKIIGAVALVSIIAAGYLLYKTEKSNIGYKRS